MIERKCSSCSVTITEANRLKHRPRCRECYLKYQAEYRARTRGEIGSELRSAWNARSARYRRKWREETFKAKRESQYQMVLREKRISTYQGNINE